MWLCTFTTTYRVGGIEYRGTVTAGSRLAAGNTLRWTGFTLGCLLHEGWRYAGDCVEVTAPEAVEVHSPVECSPSFRPNIIIEDSEGAS